jgi:hypothetical protein
MMVLPNRLRILVVVLLFVVEACGAEGAPSDIVSDGPPITESETGRIVGQPVDVEAFRVDVTAEGAAVFFVSGTVPSPCHEAFFGFEEPDKNGVMLGTTESWFDPTCTIDGGATAFSESMELTILEPGDYLARLDEGFEARFSIPNRAVDSAAGDLRLIVLPDSSGRMPGDLELGCPSGPTFPASALEEIRPLSGAGLDEIETAIRGFLDNEEGQYWPQDDWQILHETEDTVLLVHHEGTDGESNFAFQTVERVGGEWRWAGSSMGGPCPLRTSLPEGLNNVEWRIDPAAEPLTADSASVELLVTERECVSGQAMGERLLGPEIVTTGDSVFIAFAAVPPPGDVQDCQGNPQQSVVVHLAEPLGNRVISDGLAVAGHLEDFLN